MMKLTLIIHFVSIIFLGIAEGKNYSILPSRKILNWREISEREENVIAQAQHSFSVAHDLSYLEYPLIFGFYGERPHINGVKSWTLNNNRLICNHYIHFDAIWYSQFHKYYTSTCMPRGIWWVKPILRSMYRCTKSINIHPYLQNSLLKTKQLLDIQHAPSKEPYINSYQEFVAEECGQSLLFYIKLGDNKRLGILQCSTARCEEEIRKLPIESTFVVKAPYQCLKTLNQNIEDIRHIYRYIYDAVMFSNFDVYQQLWLGLRLNTPSLKAQFLVENIISSESQKLLSASVNEVWESFSPKKGTNKTWKCVRPYYDSDLAVRAKYVIMAIENQEVIYSVSRLNIKTINRLLHLLNNNPPSIPKQFQNLCNMYHLPPMKARDFWLMVINIELMHKGRTWLQDNENIVNHARYLSCFPKWMKDISKIKPNHVFVNSKKYCNGLKEFEIYWYSCLQKTWGNLFHSSIINDELSDYVYKLSTRIMSPETDLWRYHDRSHK